jgi:hypothetical protein
MKPGKETKNTKGPANKVNEVKRGKLRHKNKRIQE